VSANDDQADVERVLAGDISAFEGIVRRWQGPLINLAYRFCRDRGRAEEMAQEAFLRAFRALGQWRKDAVFSTWLFALATNLYRSELRRIPALTVSLDGIAEPPDARASDGGLEDQDRDLAVRRAVGALPAKGEISRGLDSFLLSRHGHHHRGAESRTARGHGQGEIVSRAGDFAQ